MSDIICFQFASHLLKNPTTTLASAKYPWKSERSSLHTIHSKERHVILQRALSLIEFPKHLKEITIISQILSDGTHSISTCEKTLCHNAKVIRQWRKRRSIIRLLLHRMHQSRLRTFKGLLNSSMSLICTFLSATNHAKCWKS